MEIIKYGKHIGTAKVVSDMLSEMEVELSDGEHETFAHKAQEGGWKLLFEGLGGERCYNPNAPSYDIRQKEK